MNEPSTLPSSRYSRHWKQGLWIVVLLMGTMLSVSGIVNYQKSADDAERITEAQVLFMLPQFRRQLRQIQQPSMDLVRGLMDIDEEPHIHYMGLYDSNGRLLYETGNNRLPFSLNIRPGSQTNDGFHVDIEFLDHGRIAHVTASLSRPTRRPGFRVRRQETPTPPPSVLRIEMTPEQAIALRQRAFSMMLLQILTSLILLGTAGIFWRMSIKQEQLEARLNRDQQLKVLGQMSAVLGHEIRNTIASLKGHAQLLNEHRPPLIRETTSTSLILRDIDYLQNLTQQILDFSKTGELHMEKVYLDDLVEAAVTFCDCGDIERHLPDPPPCRPLDRHKMQQVLINLLQNARSADPVNPIRLHVEQDRTLRIRITDRGKGIPEDILPRIFDPFFTTRAQGTGLGLAFAEQVVQAHGGTIDVISRLDSGSTFTIELPEETTALPTEETTA